MSPGPAGLLGRAGSTQVTQTGASGDMSTVYCELLHQQRDRTDLTTDDVPAINSQTKAELSKPKIRREIRYFTGATPLPTGLLNGTFGSELLWVSLDIQESHANLLQCSLT